MLTLLAHLTQSGRLRGKVIIVLKFYINFFSLKPLDQLEPNLIGMFIGWSSTKKNCVIRRGTRQKPPG